ncbi:MAG: hypothetical protein Kow0020_01590 [Wenzhouxiangellaceae bacterium]
MFEQLSQKARFRRWLEDLATGKTSTFSEPSELADIARVALESEDAMRRELRRLKQQAADTQQRLAALAGLDEPATEAELFERLERKLRNPLAAVDTASAPAAPVPDASQEQRLRELEAALDEAELKLATENRKLKAVVRYAYRLRRLVQSIYLQGELTDRHRQVIEDLLRAGGVPVDGDRKVVTRN